MGVLITVAVILFGFGPTYMLIFKRSEIILIETCVFDDDGNEEYSDINHNDDYPKSNRLFAIFKHGSDWVFNTYWVSADLREKYNDKDLNELSDLFIGNEGELVSAGFKELSIQVSFEKIDLVCRLRKASTPQEAA